MPGPIVKVDINVNCLKNHPIVEQNGFCLVRSSSQQRHMSSLFRFWKQLLEEEMTIYIHVGKRADAFYLDILQIKHFLIVVNIGKGFLSNIKRLGVKLRSKNSQTSPSHRAIHAPAQLESISPLTVVHFSKKTFLRGAVTHFEAALLVNQFRKRRQRHINQRSITASNWHRVSNKIANTRISPQFQGVVLQGAELQQPAIKSGSWTTPYN